MWGGCQNADLPDVNQRKDPSRWDSFLKVQTKLWILVYAATFTCGAEEFVE
jgi:hypothetical protein